MKNNYFFGGIFGAILILSGCASDRLKPAEALPGGNVRSAPPAEQFSESQILARAASQPPVPVAGEGWRPMFDGQSLAGWRITDFGGTSRAEVRKGLILLPAGQAFTGISWTNPTLKVDYEISLEAMRVSGSDFFCGLTFPVRDSFCSLIVGGWGGSIVGLSSLDGQDASENETTKYISFEPGRWYHVRLRVTTEKIEAWVEQKKVANVTTTGRKVALRFGEIELSKPLGIASWETGAALREIKIRDVSAPDSAAE